MQFAYDADPTGASSFDVYRYFRLRVKPIEIHLDGVFVAGLFLVLDPLLNGITKTGSIEGEGAVPGVSPPQPDGDSLLKFTMTQLVAPVPIPPQDTVYVDLARVEPTALVITVNLGSDEELKEILRTYGISPFYLTLIKRVARLENWSLDLRKGYYDALTMHKFTYRYSNLVTRDVLRQLHELVFNFTKRFAKYARLAKGSQVTTKVRDPMVVDGDGVIHVYGPGNQPRALEEERERRAALVIERFLLHIVTHGGVQASSNQHLQSHR